MSFFDTSHSPVVRGIRKGIQRAAVFFAVKGLTLAESLGKREHGKPADKDWDSTKAVSQGFKASSYVYGSVMRLAKAIASVPPKLQKRGSGGVWEDAQPVGEQQTLLLRTLSHPNAHMSRQDLFERSTIHLGLSGNAIWSLVWVGGNTETSRRLQEIWPLNPAYVQVIRDQTKFISHYEYKTPKMDKPQKIAVEDIVHFQFSDPENPWWGMSPLQAGAQTIDTENEAVKWQKNSLRNRATKDGMLTFKHNLTQAQFDKVVSLVDSQVGGAAAARGLMILGHEAEFTPFTMTPADMDYISGRKFLREEISGALYGVPPPLVGAYDRAALANIRIARLIFWLDTIIPILEDLYSTLTRTLVVRIGLDPEQWRLHYDLSQVQALKHDLRDQSVVAKTFWSMGIPFHIINRRLGLGFERFDGDEVGWLPMSTSPSEAGREGGAEGGRPPGGQDPSGLESDTSDKSTNGGLEEAFVTFRPIAQFLHDYGGDT